MSYQVPARKWRPRVFDEVLGQAHVVRALVNALELGRIHHAYLFAGTRGVGKTTLARILAKCLNCETGITAKPCEECSACRQIDEGRFVDLLEIDAASRTGVDDMRELLESVNYAPGAGRFKVYLIDEVHMLSTSSFNALLKTLEEPPDHVKFFFATTHPRKLPVTILSRCLQFNLTRLLPGELEEYFTRKLKDESVPFEEAALKQVAIAAEGSVRDGLSLLDQAIAYGNGSLNTEEIEAMLGLAARDEVTGLLHCVADGDAKELLARVNNLYRKAVDFAGVLGDLVELLHAIAVAQAVPDAEAPAQFNAEEVVALAKALSPEDVQLFYQIALGGKRDLPFLPDARNAFEMTMLRMLSFRPVVNVSAGASAGATAEAAAASAPVPAPAPATDADETAPPSTSPPLPPPREQELAPAAPARNNGGGDSLSLTDFTAAERWPELIDRLQLAGAQREICFNSVFSVQSGGEVTLAVDKALHSIKTPEREKKIQDAFSRLVGHEVKVNFTEASPEEETPEQAEQRKRLKRQHDAEDAVNRDAVVQSLKEGFGADVVPGSTKPLENSDQ